MRRMLVPFLALVVVMPAMVVAVPNRGSAQPATPAADADPEANKALLRRFFEIANSGDLDALTEVVSPDMVVHTAGPDEDPGLAGLRANLEMARAGLPDFTFLVHDVIAEGNVVVARVTIRGTHLGDFFGSPPTGKTIETEAIDLWHVDNGKLAENWHLEDFLRVLQQLGTVPNGGEMATPAPESPAATPVVTADAATIEENKALARRFYDEIFEQGNLDVADETLAPDVVWHAEVAPGPEGVKEFATTVRSAFPDLRLTADQVVAEGDRVVILWTLSGTHQAEFFGVPATGRSVTIPGIDIYRTADGRIAEIWTVGDDLGLLVQLGAIPGFGEPEATPSA